VRTRVDGTAPLGAVVRLAALFAGACDFYIPVLESQD